MFIILLVHVDNNHCWTYAPIQSSTGKTFLPDMNTNDGKPKSFTDLLSTYKKKETDDDCKIIIFLELVFLCVIYL